MANYTLSSAKTWGCVLGELFDYVDGVCNPNARLRQGRFRSLRRGCHPPLRRGWDLPPPGGLETLAARPRWKARGPFTLTTPVDVNGFGDTLDDRAVVNGVQTTLDQFRGTPYMQVDLRVTGPFTLRERWTVMPFIEFFNLFNRNNPGANYVTNLCRAANARQQSRQRHGVLPKRGVHPDHAHYQSQTIAGARRRVG